MDPKYYEGDTPRTIARKERRDAGDRSAAAAHTLMELKPSALASLGLDAELREQVDRDRAVTERGARRRAERHLAGVLRQADLDDLEARLERVQEGGQADGRSFKIAESWRARLIAGEASVEDFRAAAPGVDAPAFARQVESAKREATVGKPRGAARALFRTIVAELGRR
jgi:ribosomal 50S subunit-associated protein YjgA (DUF615 family)